VGRPDPADPYALLGVDPAATPGEIRRAFRRLARGAHPDAGGDPDRFLALRRALDTLCDPLARARLDELRREAAESGSTAQQVLRPAGSDEARHIAEEMARLRSRWPALRSTWRLDVDVVAPGPAVDVVLAGAGVRAARQPEVLALDAGDGAVRWRAGLAAAARSVVVLGADLVGVVTLDGVVHGLDAHRGTTRWERRLTTPPTSLVGHGEVGVVVAPEALTALRANGEVDWVVRPHGGVDAVVAAGPVLAVRTGTGAVVGVDPRTGGTRWWLRDTAPWTFPPAMSGGLAWLPGGSVAPGGPGRAGDATGRLVAVDPRSGAAVRVLDLPSSVVSAHDVDGQLVVVDADDGLTAVRGGRPRWRMVVPAHPSEPATLDGAVAVATSDGVLRLLSARFGTEVDQLAIDLPPGGPARLLVGETAVVVVGGGEGGAVGHRVATPAAEPSPR